MPKGKVAVLTDGGYRHATSLAEAFIAAGVRVLINNPADDSLAKAHPGMVEYAQFDLTSFAEADKLADFTAEKFGSADILVHTNNKPVIMSIEESDVRDVMGVIDFNAKTAYAATRAFGRVMGDCGGGVILYLSSIHAEKATGCAFSYSMAKSALRLLVREASMQYGPAGVRINLIEAGPSEGDDALFFQSAHSNLYNDMSEKNFVGGPVTGDDVAGLVTKLALDPVNSLTGACIRLDGGYIQYYIGRAKEEA